MTVSPIKRIGAGALAVAALSLTACGSAASGGGSAASGSSGSGSGSGTPSETLTIGYDSDPAPQGYDPLLYGAGQRMFYESMYQSLFVETSTGGAAPGLVTSYTYNASEDAADAHAEVRRHLHRRVRADRPARQGEP